MIIEINIVLQQILTGVPELLVHIQLDYEIEKRIIILRELQRDQEMYEYELRNSVAYQSTHGSEHEKVELKIKVEDQRVEFNRRGEEKKEEDKKGIEEEIRRRRREGSGGRSGGGGSGGGGGRNNIGGDHIIFGGRHRTSKIDKVEGEMTDCTIKMKIEKEKELKGENTIRIKKIKTHLEIIEIFKASQRGLLSYIRAVSMNNGATWVEASDCIMKSEENMKSILQLSFYDTHHLSSTSTSTSCASSSPNFGNYAEQSVQDSIKSLSSETICSLSQFAPITIPTDFIVHPNYYDSAKNGSMNFDEDKEAGHNMNERIENLPKYNKKTNIRPILDVIGIKINSFKNSISAIKMFLSARIIVSKF